MSITLQVGLPPFIQLAWPYQINIVKVPDAEDWHELAAIAFLLISMTMTTTESHVIWIINNISGVETSDVLAKWPRHTKTTNKSSMLVHVIDL